MPRPQRASWAGVWTTLWLAGCADDPAAPARLELTPGPQHRAVIVSAGDPETGPLVAWDPREAPPTPLQLDFPAEGPLEVTAMYYAAALDKLGLDAGQVFRRASGRALPTPDEVARANVRPEAPPEWQLIEEMPAALRAVRVQRRTPCADFEQSVVDLPFSDYVTGVEIGPDGSAWVLAAGGTLWRFDRTGEASMLAQGLPGQALVQGPPGVAWVGGVGGRVARVEVQGTSAMVTETSSVPGGGTIAVLAVPPNGVSPPFALTSGQTLFGGGPDDWRELGRVTELLEDIGGLAALSPTEAILGFSGGLLAYRWDGVEFRAEEVPANALDSGLTAVGYFPPFGTVIGTAVGELLVQPLGEDSWVRLEGALFTLDIEDLAAYQDGFVSTDERGVVVQYVPGFGFCDPILPLPQATAEGQHLARSGPDLVTVGVPPDGPPNPQLFWYLRGSL